jgi:hypothetical protein
VLRKERYVLAPLAERGQVHPKDGKPVIQVGPQTTRSNVLEQVSVRRGDDPHVDDMKNVLT